MASPVIESVNPTVDDTQTGGAATSGSTNATSHDVVLPATVSADALLLIVGRVVGVGTVTVPAGWTVVQGDYDGSDNIQFYTYKNTLAAGTEDGATVAIGHGSGRLVAISMSITGAADPAVQPPEFTIQSGLGVSPNGPLLTPTGEDAKDYLWLWIGGWEGTQNSGNSPPATSWPPSFFTSVRGASTGVDGATNNAQLAIAYRALSATSLDPAATTLSATDDWTALTMAVHPPIPVPTEPPVNTVAPALTGSAVSTFVLTCSTGNWTNPPSTYAYQWKRNGTNISGATSSTYTLTGADVDQAIKCTVTATNVVGSTAADSNTVTPDPDVAPVNTALPVISGTPLLGEVLSCSTGTWDNSPTSYVWQWRRNGVNISGSTGGSYTLIESDVGQTITCRITATNVVGSTSATASSVTPDGVEPSLSVSPAISGSPFVGNSISCSTGTWEHLPTSFAYQWELDEVAISGATSNSYVPTPDDVGEPISCLVTASNAYGSAAARSNDVVVTALPPAGAYLPNIYLDDIGDEAVGDFAPLIDTYGDPDEVLQTFLRGFARMLKDVDDISADGTNDEPGWSQVFDLSRAKTTWLAWMGQLVGYRVPRQPDTQSLEDYDTEQRDRMVTRNAWLRGTVSSITLAAQDHLYEPKRVIVQERIGGPWVIRVSVMEIQVKTSEAELRSAVYADKVAGLLLEVNVLVGNDYLTLRANNDDYAELKAKHATYESVLLDPGL